VSDDCYFLFEPLSIFHYRRVKRGMWFSIFDLVTSQNRGQGMVTFQQAYEAAVARYAPGYWASLSPPQIIGAIYEELRRLDAESVDPTIVAHLSERGTSNGRSYYHRVKR